MVTKLIIISLVLTIGPLNNLGTHCPIAATQTRGARAIPNEWREDLRFLATELKKRHVDLFHKVTEQEFDSAVANLGRRLDRLSPHQIIVEMARIVAMVGEGHTHLVLPREGRWKFSRYPIRYYMYGDGLYVQAAAREYASVVGARVTQIGDLPVEQVLQRVRPLVHHDNDMTVKLLIPFFLNTPEVLESVGIARDARRATLTATRPDSSKDIRVELAPQREGIKIEWVSSNDSASLPAPLWLRDPRNNYWFQYLELTRTIYLQFNSVRDKAGESISQFSERLYNFIQHNPVDKLVLDLRMNDGGNSRLSLPLLHALIRSDKINQPGKLFVVIGRATFSAAMVFAVWVEQHTSAIFVGEPTGGRPNQYGEMLGFTLPNSGILVNYSAYYFQTAGPFDNRQWIAPAVSTEPSMKDHIANHDPAVEAIGNYAHSKPLSTELMALSTTKSVQDALMYYREFKKNPMNAYLDTENDVRRTGDQLLQMKRYDDAILIFRLNVEAYPDRARPFYSMAEVYNSNGAKTLARQFYEKGLAVLRTDQSVHKGLRERLENIARQKLEELK